MISIFIALLIGALIFGCAVYIINTCFPEPMRKIAIIIVGVIALIVLLSYFTGNLSTGNRAVILSSAGLHTAS